MSDAYEKAVQHTINNLIRERDEALRRIDVSNVMLANILDNFESMGERLPFPASVKDRIRACIRANEDVLYTKPDSDAGEGGG